MNSGSDMLRVRVSLSRIPTSSEVGPSWFSLHTAPHVLAFLRTHLVRGGSVMLQATTSAKNVESGSLSVRAARMI